MDTVRDFACSRKIGEEVSLLVMMSNAKERWVKPYTVKC